MNKILILLAFLAGIFVLPTTAAERGKRIEIGQVTSTYQGDRRFFNRVWYSKRSKRLRRQRQKQYRQRKYRQRANIRRNRAAKRRASQRRLRRSPTKRAAYVPRKKKKSVSRRISSRNLRPGKGRGVVAKVSLGNQRMNVYRNGKLQYTWKVSTGRSGYATPRGSWRVHRMHKRYYSKKYDLAPMPYAMFFKGGYAIHGTGSIKRLGRRASHGCVRLHPANAAKLFAMIRQSGGVVKITN